MRVASLLVGLLAGLAAAVPFTSSVDAEHEQGVSVNKRATGPFWVGNVAHRGTVPYGGSSGYSVYRNVQDYGAKGDGKTDDTAAINNAISAGNRCGQGCDSSTVSPAIVYFPPGTYMVSSPIIQYYYTQFVGDAVNIPILKATSNFQGIAVVDSDPYTSGGNNWYTNQNNFFRQVRNFVIDLTNLPENTGTGIHWQVAQATSLQNIVFQMRPKSSGNKQQGIFMDNGSGGFMSDLTFNGGNYGAFFGNQQFTTRNMTFNGCNTAIYMNWNWVWSLKSLSINNCGVGINMANVGSVGSVVLQDSSFTNTPIGVQYAFSSSSSPNTGDTLILSNVDARACSTGAVVDNNGNRILAAGNIATWVAGRTYVGSSGSRGYGSQSAPSVPSALLSNGKIAERSKPQYNNLPASSFVSVKSKGAAGDGVTDDTAAIQNAMNSVAGTGSVLYFDHGAYVVSNTIVVPANIKIVGEIWPLIMAKGNAFQDQNNPKPVWQVGNSGDVGNVEIQDLIFETIGPQPGAIMVEWNVAGSSPGAAAMWDCHFRIGGTAGTQLQSDKCSKNPSVTANANSACIGAFMLFHATSSSSVYLENVWAWVADHELDRSDHNQINIFNGRGILIEATKGTWLYGTSAEHSTLYNYLLYKASNVYMSAIQSETAYFQENPNALQPFAPQSSRGDPTFSVCASNDPTCFATWGLRVDSCSNVLVYGTGLYSFFQNYDQTCVNNNNCQRNMIHVTNSQNTQLFGVSTKAAVNMISYNNSPMALDADNRNNFCATVARWTSS